MAAEGVAAEEPPEGEPCAADGPVTLVGLDGVAAACGLEPAVATHEGTKEDLIDADEEDKGAGGEAAGP